MISYETIMTSLSITKSTVGTGQLTRIQRAYKVIAPAYDRLRPLWTGGALGHAERFLERRALPQYCPPGATVLDLGCGTGANLERLLRTGIPVSRYVGVDISPAMLQRARQKFSWLKSAEFYIGDIARLSFSDNTFDFALSTWALEHVPQIEVAVTEALRVLKRGAHLAVLFHSIPDFPWSIPVRLVEPIFRLAFLIRFLDPDYQFSMSLEHHWHFAKGLHTLLLLAKDEYA